MRENKPLFRIRCGLWSANKAHRSHLNTPSRSPKRRTACERAVPRLGASETPDIENPEQHRQNAGVAPEAKTLLEAVRFAREGAHASDYRGAHNANLYGSRC